MATATRPSRDQVVMRLATEEGVTDQGVIAKRLVELGYGKITDTRVGQILRANSGRDQIVRFLEEHPDDTFTSVEISTWTKIDINKVNYVIDALQKKGVVTYKVGQSTSNHRTLVSVSLTKRARAAIAARKDAAIKRSPAVDAAKLNGEAPVEMAATEAKHAIIEEVVPEVPEIPELSEIVTSAPADEAPAEDTGHEVLPIQDFLKYPLIAKLLDRERDLNEAAKLLDRHGLDDLELQVLAKMDEYTPLEREVVAYVDAHIKTCKQR